MRPEPNLRIDAYRLRAKGYESPQGVNWGAFLVVHNKKTLRVISSGVDEIHGWEHVSVSLRQRCPTWSEMNFVKGLFWLPEEAVVQFHPPESTYVNNAPNCLHMWRPIDSDVILPPPHLVGTFNPDQRVEKPPNAQVIAQCVRETAGRILAELGEGVDR